MLCGLLEVSNVCFCSCYHRSKEELFVCEWLERGEEGGVECLLLCEWWRGVSLALSLAEESVCPLLFRECTLVCVFFVDWSSERCGGEPPALLLVFGVPFAVFLVVWGMDAVSFSCRECVLHCRLSEGVLLCSQTHSSVDRVRKVVREYLLLCCWLRDRGSGRGGGGGVSTALFQVTECGWLLVRRVCALWIVVSRFVLGIIEVWMVLGVFGECLLLEWSGGVCFALLVTDSYLWLCMSEGMNAVLSPVSGSVLLAVCGCLDDLFWCDECLLFSERDGHCFFVDVNMGLFSPLSRCGMRVCAHFACC